jgi:hypothetical protein
MNSTARYALVALDPDQPEPPRTLASGPLSDATKLIPGSLALAQARADADADAKTLREFAAEHQQHAVRLQYVEDTLAGVKADLVQIINDFGDYFSGLKAEHDAERQRQAREDTSRAELRAAMDALSPDPDAPVGDAHGAPPAPSLEPPLREEGEDHGAYGYPDGPETQAPGHPAELAYDSPSRDQWAIARD